MRRGELIFKTIDKMDLHELYQLRRSNNTEIMKFKSYIDLKIEEKNILKKYLKIA